MTRPLVRKHGKWWRLFWGDQPDINYYASEQQAVHAARRISITEANR